MVTDQRLVGFTPVIHGQPHTLILGSMPGVVSLQQQQYYAHPRNAFWPIVTALLEFPAGLSYAGRVQSLSDCGYALWDVLGHCQRPGSLDANISAPEANDFAGLLADYPSIERIFLNGGAAAKLWKKQVEPTLLHKPVTVQLPSTSPAYAAMPLAEKRERWQQILR